MPATQNHSTTISEEQQFRQELREFQQDSAELTSGLKRLNRDIAKLHKRQDKLNTTLAAILAILKQIPTPPKGGNLF